MDVLNSKVSSHDANIIFKLEVIISMLPVRHRIPVDADRDDLQRLDAPLGPRRWVKII
jgi:hypothetical protein